MPFFKGFNVKGWSKTEVVGNWSNQLNLKKLRIDEINGFVLLYCIINRSIFNEEISIIDSYKEIIIN